MRKMKRPQQALHLWSIQKSAVPPRNRCGTEGCLSIPGFAGDVERMESITIKGRNRFGKPFVSKPTAGYPEFSNMRLITWMAFFLPTEPHGSLPWRKKLDRQCCEIDCDEPICS